MRGRRIPVNGSGVIAQGHICSTQSKRSSAGAHKEGVTREAFSIGLSYCGLMNQHEGQEKGWRCGITLGSWVLR